MADQSHDHETATAEPEIADLDLRAAIEEALWSLDGVRVARPALNIAVNRGQATVSGIVQSPMMRSEIARALAGWPVELFLMDDATIQSTAAFALAMDARTSAIPLGYQVNSHNGRVTVHGKFTPEQAQPVKDVVSEVTGVTSVVVL